MQRSLTAIRTACALVVLVLVCSGAARVSAQPALEGGWVRLGHFAAAEAPVDLLVDGTPIATDVAFRTVSPYVRVTAGVHRFTVTPAGVNTDELLDLEASVPEDGAVTVAAVAGRNGLGGEVYDDELPSPAAGQALVRVIHTVPDVPAVDVVVPGGPRLVTNLAYPDASAYRGVAAGVYDVEVRAAGTTDTLLRMEGWRADSGSLVSVVVLRGLDGDLDVAPVNDATAAAQVPQGGLATGFGGTAPISDQRSSAWLVLPAGFALLVLAIVHRVRARRATPS